MSEADTNILSPNTHFKLVKVFVDDYEILHNDLITFQLDQSLATGALTGTIQIKDTFDMFNNSKATFDNTNIVKISMRDFFDNPVIRTFRITTSSHRSYNSRHRLVSFGLVDEITYVLSHAFVDKYYDSAVDGIESIIREMCSSIIGSNRLTFNTEANTEITSADVLINSSASLLDSITNKLAKYNMRLFQSRNQINICEIIPSNLSINENVFTDKTINYSYMYRIYDKEAITSQNVNMPIAKAYRIVGKEILTDTLNLSDIAEQMNMNSNTLSYDNIQDTTGHQLIYQAEQSVGRRKMKVFDKFISLNSMVICVPGTFNTSVGDGIEVEFVGITGFTDITQEGDTLNSGKYLVSSVSDLCVGVKFIQRLQITRMVNKKPRVIT